MALLVPTFPSTYGPLCRGRNEAGGLFPGITPLRIASLEKESVTDGHRQELGVVTAEAWVCWRGQRRPPEWAMDRGLKLEVASRPNAGTQAAASQGS